MVKELKLLLLAGIRTMTPNAVTVMAQPGDLKERFLCVEKFWNDAAGFTPAG